MTIAGQAATVVEATATGSGAGISTGTSRLAYIVSLPGGGTMTIQTTGQAGDATFVENSNVTTLMAATLKDSGVLSGESANRQRTAAGETRRPFRQPGRSRRLRAAPRRPRRG